MTVAVLFARQTDNCNNFDACNGFLYVCAQSFTGEPRAHSALLTVAVLFAWQVLECLVYAIERCPTTYYSTNNDDAIRNQCSWNSEAGQYGTCEPSEACASD